MYASERCNYGEFSTFSFQSENQTKIKPEIGLAAEHARIENCV